MHTQSTGIKSYTGPQGNTVYWGARKTQGQHRSVATARVAFDRGSDGTIDGAAGAIRARGPKGSMMAAAAMTTNQQTNNTWGRYLGEKESFDASIIGDPHFSIDGSINGEEVSTKFDNQDLGSRTQYAGAGFKLDTETVPWGDNGAAVVGSATVSTGFGRAQDQVTVNADGSVLVNDEQVSLEAGDSMQLNRTSSLALNDDGTYTVSSRNGKVTNTFDVKEHDTGNYININSSVDDVQTVGWLQQQA